MTTLSTGAMLAGWNVLNNSTKSLLPIGPDRLGERQQLHVVIYTRWIKQQIRVLPIVREDKFSVGESKRIMLGKLASKVSCYACHNYTFLDLITITLNLSTASGKEKKNRFFTIQFGDIVKDRTVSIFLRKMSAQSYCQY